MIPTKYYLATPAGGPIEPECAEGFAALAVFLALKGELSRRHDFKPWDVEPRDVNLPRARNALFHRFLQSDADVFVGVDDDQLPTLEQFDVLRQSMIEADVDVATPMIVRKNLNHELVGRPINPFELRGDFVRMQRIGFGMFLVRRHVVERLAKDAVEHGHTFVHNVNRHPDAGKRLPMVVRPRVTPDGIWELDDDAFSRDWTACGGTLWQHQSLIVGHVGPHVFV